MIKLIVCDVDGTLLQKGETEISREVREIICSAAEKGIMFAVASGRAYHELKRMFDGLDIYYIPSDGAAVIYKEKTLYGAYIRPFSAEKLLLPLTQTQGIAAVAVGKYLSYIIKGENVGEDFAKEIIGSLNGHAVTAENLGETEEDILKLSFYGEAKSVFGKKLLSGTADGLTKIVYKKDGWTEFVSSYAGKERAVLKLLSLLKLKRDEIAVIGDGENDAEMLKLTKNSAAVKGGHKSAEEAANFITENAEKTIEDIIRKGEIYDVL